MECLRRRISSSTLNKDRDPNLLSLAGFPSRTLTQGDRDKNCPLDELSSGAAFLSVDLGSLAAPALDPASNEDIVMCDLTTDWFCWLVEGVLILVVGCFGLLGNSFSLVLFSRQKVHRIFHRLLLTLTIFDLVSEKVSFAEG